MDIQIGSKSTYTIKVEQSNTAKTMGSGSLEVFATPSMVAIMEKASTMAVEKYLDDGTTTVGTSIDITHGSPTPVGMNVSATAEVIAVNGNGREITFKVQAFDKVGLIGEGIHKRFVVNVERFKHTVNKKKS